MPVVQRRPQERLGFARQALHEILRGGIKTRAPLQCRVQAIELRQHLRRRRRFARVIEPRQCGAPERSQLVRHRHAAQVVDGVEFSDPILAATGKHQDGHHQAQRSSAEGRQDGTPGKGR